MPDFAKPSVATDPIPAATLVVCRDRAGGPPELLMVERARAMAFAGGALVFPGGRIDPGDAALAQIHAPGDEYGAARIAAIRETIEEAGIAIGVVPLPATDVLVAIRQGLHDGEPFGALLNEHDLSLDLSALTAFARWCPNHPTMRIFDTMFFLAALPHGAPDPIVDATENSRVFWATAQQVLDDADAGLVAIIFPTRRNLERLALFDDFHGAISDARAHDIRTVTPWTETREGIDFLCIPDDLGYPVTVEPLSRIRRG